MYQSQNNLAACEALSWTSVTAQVVETTEAELAYETICYAINNSHSV